MNTKCTCDLKFMDAEDWRDHMPCPGNDADKLREANKEIARLNAVIAGIENKPTARNWDTREWINSDDLPCSTCGVWACDGAPRFKGICPEFTKNRLNTKSVL